MSLDADPNQSRSACIYGLHLIQAGHGDGALMAFDKVLSQAPNFPMALWGKGMVLYAGEKRFCRRPGKSWRVAKSGSARRRTKRGCQSARRYPDDRRRTKPCRCSGKERRRDIFLSAQISGKITVDPKLKANIDRNATLFIIARPATGAGGPPLAVKKIDRPTFPVDYTLSQDNVMMQGLPSPAKSTSPFALTKTTIPSLAPPAT